jgi:hypothetical protein
MIWQEREDGSEKSFWILHTQEAQDYLTTHLAEPARHHNAALAAIDHLRSTHWLDQSTMTVELRFSTYSEMPRMFTHNTVRIRIDRLGYPRNSQFTYAVPAEAYTHWAYLILDGVFMVLVFTPAVQELMDIFNQIRLAGYEGFKDYWGFWNVVDWANVLFGLTLATAWGMLCWNITSDTIQSALTPDFQLAPQTVDYTEEQLNANMEQLDAVVLWFRLVHWMACINTMGVMLKFFKAFQSNARLQVASQTMINAGRDLFHFMIVFASVFNAYDHWTLVVLQ